MLKFFTPGEPGRLWTIKTNFVPESATCGRIKELSNKLGQNRAFVDAANTMIDAPFFEILPIIVTLAVPNIVSHHKQPAVPGPPR